MSTVEETLAEREKRYGNFENHAHIAQSLKHVMRQTPRWGVLRDDQLESLEMIQHKIARILNGDASYADNWHDIAGYATLVEQELKSDEDELHPRPGDREAGFASGLPT